MHTILAEWDIRPQKSLGQNFLIDANILGIMLATAGITAGDAVLEIGAGLGVLTEPLARVACRVVTVEKDPRLWPLLKERLQAFSNVELICADMLKVDHEALFRSGISKVVANLPYSVGSAILVNLVQAETPPAQLTVTLQQEVAKRLIAKPGHKDFGLLTLWTQLRYDVTIRKTVSPTCFYPAPGISSAILNLVRREQPTANHPADNYPDRHFFYALTKYAFARRRKQLKTILCDANITHSVIHPPAPRRFGGHGNLPIETYLPAGNVLAVFQKLGIDPQTRPEDLSVAIWRRLAKALGRY
ncbi:MAG: 16S rRNA (adenine(1518)-N(6)/adenine(1519)-N(6))-dimethyltransferase RsmA [Verrucomicrobiota bacterium]